jgi:hypothetical protein
MPLKTLALWQSDISYEDLNGFLVFAPMLEDFRCGFLRDHGNLQDSDLADFDELCLTLKPVSDTLKSLRFDVRWLSTNTERVGEIRSVNPSDLLATPLRSLHAFSALRRLQVPFEFLTGPAPYIDVKSSKTLPRGLGILILSDPMVMWDGVATRGANRCLQDIVDVLADYLKDRQVHAPYLQYIIFDLSRGIPYDDTCPFSGSWDEEGNYPIEAVNLRAIGLKSRVTLLVYFMRSEGGSVLLHIDGLAQEARMVQEAK